MGESRLKLPYILVITSLLYLCQIVTVIDFLAYFLVLLLSPLVHSIVTIL